MVGDEPPTAAVARNGEQPPLVCPGCAREHPPSERFCATCGMPLVHNAGAEQETTKRQQAARKIKPEYAEGPLVKVASAETQPEAEFIAGLLLEVLVPESGAQAAREALAFEAEV
jgi:hypothetical protein